MQGRPGNQGLQGARGAPGPPVSQSAKVIWWLESFLDTKTNKEKDMDGKGNMKKFEGEKMLGRFGDACMFNPSQLLMHCMFCMRNSY